MSNNEIDDVEIVTPGASNDEGSDIEPIQVEPAVDPSPPGLKDVSTAKLATESTNNEDNSNTNEEFGEVLEVEDIEAVPIEEREVIEEIFIRIMEDDLLRDVPVYQQSNLRVQEQIHQKAIDLWNLKEEGDRILSQERAGNKDYRPLVDSLDQGFFHKAPWVIPAVLDIHKIYSLRCSKNVDETNESDEEDEEFTGEVKFGDVLENQFEQMKTIQKLLKNLYENNINYASYASGVAKVTDPYKPADQKLWEESPEPLPKAYRLRLRDYEQLVRIIDLKKKPKMRVGRGPQVINIYVPEKKKIESVIEHSQERKILTAQAGEEIDIVGFLILPSSKDIDRSIQKALDNTKILDEKKDVPDIDPRKEQLILFPSSSNTKVSFEFYSKVIRKLAPTSEQAVDIALEQIAEPSIEDVGNELRKWGLNIGTISAEAWQKAREVIAKTAEEPVPRSITGFKLDDIGKLCKLEDELYLLRDDQYRSKFMRMIYDKDLAYTEDLRRGYRGPDCLQHRFNRLYETDDNGSFFYTYSYLHMRKSNLQKEVSRLNTIQKQLTTKQKQLLKEAKSGQTVDFTFDKNIDIVKVRDAFKKLSNIPKKVLDARKDVPVVEKEIENIISSKKSLNERKEVLEKSSFRKAQRLFLYRMRDVANLLRKKFISEAEIGRILHERKLQSEEREEKGEKLQALFKVEPAIQSLLTQINRLDDIQEKTNKIYTIIEYDGLLIDNFIYSVRFGVPIFCGHWYYLLLIDKASTQDQRESLVQQLLSVFGSDNKKEGSFNCSVCGSYLDRASFYESMYFAEFGLAQAQQQAYVDEKRQKMYLHSQQVRYEDSILENVKICKGATLKSELATRGLRDQEETKRAVNACDILDRILAKMDIMLAPKQFLGLILVSVQHSSKITSFQAYMKEKVREVKIKNKLSDHQTLLLENNDKFKEKVAISYSAHYITRFATLVVAHLLWHLRTMIPPESPGRKATTSCGFFGFEGDAGYGYMMCLLEEMETIRARLTIKGRKIDKRVKRKDIDNHFRYWVSTLENNYKHALERRKKFEFNEKEFMKKKGSKKLNDLEEVYDWSAEEIPPLPKDFISNLYKIWKNGDGKRLNELFNQNNLRSKRLSHQFLNDLNDVMREVGAHDKPQHIETTCCEGKVSTGLPFIAFYEEFKPTVKVIFDELQILQKQLDLMKEHEIGTQYNLESILPPTRNLNRYPIKFINFPDSFVKEAFLTYCHDGPTRGQYHNFQDVEMEEITRCLKCGWYKKKLEDTGFSKEQFTKLLIDVLEKTLVKIPNETKQKSSEHEFLTLKKEASNNLKKHIQDLSARLARVLSRSKGDSEASIRAKIEEFLTNMDDFRMFIPDPLEDASDKEKVQTFERRAYFSQERMKVYINQFLRKNISRVINGYRLKKKEIPWMSAKESEVWEERLLEKKLWLEEFLTKTNQRLFKKFVFGYTASKIDDIRGHRNIYKDDWKWIKYSSMFTPEDATKVLKHYFVSQILTFLDISDEGEPILAEFINNIFDQIESDRRVLNIPSKDVMKWKETIQEQKILAWARYFDAIKEEDALLFNAPYRRFTEKAVGDPLAETEETSEEFDKNVAKADRESFLESEAKERLGEDATEQAIESYVQDAIQEDELDEEINEEVYDNPILKEGEEVMDIGTEYGQQPQGTETEGDGFNDYTMTEAWDPVHEPNVLGAEQ